MSNNKFNSAYSTKCCLEDINLQTNNSSCSVYSDNIMLFGSTQIWNMDFTRGWGEDSQQQVGTGFCILIELSTILREIHQLSFIRRCSLDNSLSKSTFFSESEYSRQEWEKPTVSKCWSDVYVQRIIVSDTVPVGVWMFCLWRLNLGEVGRSSASTNGHCH